MIVNVTDSKSKIKIKEMRRISGHENPYGKQKYGTTHWESVLCNPRRLVLPKPSVWNISRGLRLYVLLSSMELLPFP